MPKNIVVCCDGTGNKFSGQNTNVIKLYSVLDIDDPARQVAYYHAGLGTIGAPNALSRLAQFWTKAKGLAFGYGLTRDVSDAYAYLMETWVPGDNIFLYGFSRGAYTVRALSGMLRMFGLLRSGDYNLIAYAADMLKRKKDDSSFQVAEDFKNTFSRECKTYFIGVWDTVSSVGWVWDPLHIPYTAKNPDLSIGRHAVSIDERRCFFRQNMWSDPQPGQNIKQVWFAGVHSDVGGGYPEADAGLSKLALEWMLRESHASGLLVKDAKVQEVLGRRGGKWVAPDPGAMLHNSMKDGGWFLLECLPHLYKDMSCVPYRTKVKLPLGRRRTVPHNAVIHDSVLQRQKLPLNYHPSNLPPTPQVEPWIPW
jgi:uncharacterized protein (DUF2235 family)